MIRFIKNVYWDICDFIKDFFWEYHHNGIYGPGSHAHRTLKHHNILYILCLIIITLLLLIII